VTGTFVLTDLAEADILSIWAYLSDNSGDPQADKLIRAIFAKCNWLAQFPFLGHTRKDLTPRPFRFLLVNPYLVIYEPRSKPLRIHSILHSSRDVAAELRRRTEG
jgi:plasmid stabilization system protein ParE